MNCQKQTAASAFAMHMQNVNKELLNQRAEPCCKEVNVNILMSIQIYEDVMSVSFSMMFIVLVHQCFQEAGSNGGTQTRGTAEHF